ncbi:thioredoxin domain-containing protein [Legionella cardiaca]|uniref:Thioredoxin domain-containing protein n=1 Tax=Legionella cardiaca TaxID=1071983 RepID=A0ABY8ATL0_9GAMM|nr:thioredoxin domain-containing protein [Legionella cardiaca]WED44015.1 thioredoxin domain-containing protein [Legionella cardiaca]
MSSQPHNHLIHENSPYLQQHAYNPVDWYPWGETAITKAQKENKPILLSIGYAACHWCHVMAHESFEDQETAALMNRLFINIKVDKEERPDLDKVYQTSHYYLSQQSGGWPLTIFLTPDLTPFFSGTYFPPEERYQMPSFRKVLQIMANLYQHQKEDILKQGIELKRILQQQNKTFALQLNAQPLQLALSALEQNYDEQYGGFGGAPKFPQASKLEYLLRSPSPLGLATLKHIANGGIYDQLAGGFFRYAVDRKWTIPHFEKMLYDNGQLLTLYALAAKQEPFFKQVISETANWVITTMQSPEGGYYSSLDADSEGEEGKFYRWSKTEIQTLLTQDEYDVISLHYGLNKAPNFDAHWHLYVAQSLEATSKNLKVPLANAQKLFTSAKNKLLVARNQRSHPFRDEKILTSWNALMIKGMLLAGNHLQDENYINSAQQAINFIQTKLWNNQQLLASYKNGNAYLLAYLDDYAFLLDALLTSLEVSWNTEHLLFATEIAEAVLTYFSDETFGGFFFTADNHEKLLYRPKPMMDDATPSGNGILVRALLILGHLLDDMRYIKAAEQTLKSAWSLLIRYPAEHCSLLLGLRDFLIPPEIIIIRGKKETAKIWQNLAKGINNYTFAIPGKALVLPEALEAKKTQGECCAYICQGHQCSEVIKDIASLNAYLSK